MVLCSLLAQIVLCGSPLGTHHSRKYTLVHLETLTLDWWPAQGAFLPVGFVPATPVTLFGLNSWYQNKNWLFIFIPSFGKALNPLIFTWWQSLAAYGCAWMWAAANRLVFRTASLCIAHTSLPEPADQAGNIIWPSAICNKKPRVYLGTFIPGPNVIFI